MKWLGAIILVAVSYLCGSVSANAHGEELKAIESVIKLLLYMKRRLYTERSELFDIFNGYNDDYLVSLGFLPQLCSCRGSFTENWISASEKLPMNADAKNELEIFGESLGKLNLDEQLKRLEVCINALETSKQNIEKVLPQKQKTTKTIWLLSGLLIAIILL